SRGLARANVAKSTLWRIEKDDPGVAMGNYYQLLITLQIDKDILQLASDEIFGRKLQDIGLITKKRAPKRNRE
ncbi:MAG: transcriptional regulator, partial [Candidatus Paceibacterota bacterium]